MSLYDTEFDRLFHILDEAVKITDHLNDLCDTKFIIRIVNTPYYWIIPSPSTYYAYKSIYDQTKEASTSVIVIQLVAIPISSDMIVVYFSTFACFLNAVFLFCL